VALAKIDGLSVVIKRYNIKGFWHGLGRALRKTRASVSWANAHRLQLLGIATANPVALIESRRYGLKGKAYFMTEYIDAPDMIEFFKQTSDKVLRAQAIKAITQLFYQLYLLSISHGDMKANNIKVLVTNPMLIDLDSMQQHRCKYFANKAHARDLRRFMRNWKDEPSLYNGFIKAFKVIYADHAPLVAANILK
jgi:tRNA A-37 threonylcarbamoyl transferase component Bud32